MDINPARAELARALGVSFAGAETAKGDCDLVVHASGHASGLATALALAGEEATVLEMSWYGDGAVTAPLGGAFHSRRLEAGVEPGRTDRAVAPAALDARTPALSGARFCPQMPDSTRCWRRRSRFGDCRGGCPIFSMPGSGILCQLITYP